MNGEAALSIEGKTVVNEKVLTSIARSREIALETAPARMSDASEAT